MKPKEVIHDGSSSPGFCRALAISLHECYKSNKNFQMLKKCNDKMQKMKPNETHLNKGKPLRIFASPMPQIEKVGKS